MCTMNYLFLSTVAIDHNTTSKEIAPISLSRLYSDSSPGILVLLQMVNQMSVRAEITREPYVDQLQKIAQIEYYFLFSFL